MRDKITEGLKIARKSMTEGGYKVDELFFAPEDGIAPLEEKLKEKQYDGIIIGVLIFTLS